MCSTEKIKQKTKNRGINAINMNGLHDFKNDKINRKTQNKRTKYIDI